MDNLDALSNEELKLRLLECGFANIPITSNTRKLLIKKLRNHLEGEKSKIRRETIHVTKYSSDEDASDLDNGKKKSSSSITTTTTTTTKTNRRATIGSAGSTAPNTTATSSGTAKSNVRRSGRITPSTEPVSKESASVAPSVPDIQEDTDDEIITTNTLTNNARRSKSKTPVTLSKTEPVTISVRHIKPTLENVIEDEIIINSESEDEFMSPAPRSPFKSQPKKLSPQKVFSTVTSSSSITSRKKTTYDPDDGEYEYSYSRTNDVDIPSSQPSKPFESNFLNNRYKSSTSGTGGVTGPPPRVALSTSYNNRYSSSTGSGLPKNFGSNAFGYAGTTTTYRPGGGASQTLRTYSHDSEEASENDDDYDVDHKKLEHDVLNSKYLSKFTKRLSELKAEPLVSVGDTQSKVLYGQTEVEPRNIGRYSSHLSSSTTPYQRANAMSRKSISSYKNDEKNSFFGISRSAWNEWNLKYKINRNLMILFLLLVIIFIIVLLFF